MADSKKKPNRYVSDFENDRMTENSGSVTECTGLMQTPPQSEAEYDSYLDIYDFLPLCETEEMDENDSE